MINHPSIFDLEMEMWLNRFLISKFNLEREMNRFLVLKIDLEKEVWRQDPFHIFKKFFSRNIPPR